MATYTSEQIDAQRARAASLEQMIADGVRQVTIGDQTITYNTTDSLQRALDAANEKLTVMLRANAAAEGIAGAAGRQTQLVYAGRGYW
mgnify:FL=1